MKSNEVKSGVCRVCGCIDECACPGGCSWVDKEHTLCSQCADAIGGLTEEFLTIMRKTPRLSERNVEVIILATNQGTAESGKQLRKVWEERLKKTVPHYQVFSAQIIVNSR